MKKRMDGSVADLSFEATLLAVFVLWSILWGIAPVDRTVWFAEGMTAWIPALFLCILVWRGVRFSKLAWLCMALWFFLHTIGGHYTFEKVPFDWVTNTFGFARNHYDRICHFLVGGFAFPFLEWIDRENHVRPLALAAFLAVMSIFGFAAIFELVEWGYAECADPAAGSAFLGSQGDIWDAQKDMLSDGLGAIVFSGLYVWFRKKTGKA